MSDVTAGCRLADVGGPAILVPGATDPPAGSPTAVGPVKRILQFNSENRDCPETIVGSLYAFRDPNSGSFGPLVAIVGWGSGNGAQQVAEFDIPMNQMSGGQVAPQNIQVGGGTFFEVVGTSLTVSARNDERVTPRAGDDFLGAINGIPPFVTASIGAGSRPTSRLIRTLWLVKSVLNPLAPAGIAGCAVPPFAKTAKVMRFPAGGTISVDMSTGAGAGADGPYNVAANVECPAFTLGSNVTLNITNTDGAQTISALAVEFEIGL